MLAGSWGLSMGLGFKVCGLGMFRVWGQGPLKGVVGTCRDT